MSILLLLGAKVAGLWSAAVALGWLLPLAGGTLAALSTALFGGDWELTLIALVGVGGFLFIWNRFGLRLALGWAGATLLYFVDRRGYKRGKSDQQVKEKKDADKRADARERTAKEVRSLPDPLLRQRAARWVQNH